MGVHDGHRRRLKDRFLEHGLENFNDINALELLLFFSIPRRDTNEIAHALLDRFGSLKAIFAASKRALMEVEGVGPSTAELIMLVPQIMRRSEVIAAGEIKYATSTEAAGQYLLPRFLYEEDEIFYMLCLNSQRRIICCIELERGVVNEVRVNVRKLVETALKYKASSVIIAHNHPDGVALPSAEDDVTTEQIFKALNAVGIALADHLVIADGDFVSYRESDKFRRYVWK